MSQAGHNILAVPRLSEFYGIVIYMYWNDHHPAHFHAIYGGDEAQVRIDDGTVMAGSLPLPPPDSFGSGRSCDVPR